MPVSFNSACFAASELLVVKEAPTSYYKRGKACDLLAILRKFNTKSCHFYLGDDFCLSWRQASSLYSGITLRITNMIVCQQITQKG